MLEMRLSYLLIYTHVSKQMQCHRVTEIFLKIVEPLKRKRQTLLVSTRAADILTAELTNQEPMHITYEKKTTPWLLVRKRTIRPSYRRLSAKLVPTIAERGSRGQRNGSPRLLNIGFLDRSRYFFIQVAPELSSRG
jgi:hypothetical protein